MLIQTITPTERTVTVEIPASFLNQTVEIMLVPVPYESLAQKRAEIDRFFAQHQVTDVDLSFKRDELYER